MSVAVIEVMVTKIQKHLRSTSLDIVIEERVEFSDPTSIAQGIASVVHCCFNFAPSCWDRTQRRTLGPVIRRNGVPPTTNYDKFSTKEYFSRRFTMAFVGKVEFNGLRELGGPTDLKADPPGLGSLISEPVAEV